MSEPIIAQKTPYSADVEQGKDYWWCACGQSSKQPYCDGSHKGTDFTPIQYSAKADRSVHFCGCKKTENQPLCDGSHNNL